MVETAEKSIGIDTTEDLEKARRMLWKIIIKSSIKF
jgi:CMP-2-keto-3-deoxyoctulosonic acid synthetase